jgi:hypothetical protein
VSNSQIAVGEKIVQHHYGPGSTVNNIVSGELRAPQERQKPVSQLPRDVPRLHGRAAEIDRARGAMGDGQPIQFCGPSGLGKTALLRHLSHRPGTGFADGVIYYRSRRESLDDLLMRIFEFLYESDGTTTVKPTTAELGRYLGGVEGLFLLDDVDLDREDLETLLVTVPRSVFVLGSPERSLWSDGESILLRGLGQDAAQALVEEGLARRLTIDEGIALAQLSGALEGHPLQLIKAVAQIRDEGATLAQLVSEATGGTIAAAQPPAHRLTSQAAAELPEAERRVLSLLAALDGAPLHIDHVAALTSRADAAAILADLEERRLAQSHSPRYSATAPIAALQDAEAGDRWRSALLAYFIDHAERHRAEPRQLRDDLEPIIQTLRWGVTGASCADVVRLARASAVIAESAGLWDAWRSILDLALEAARAIGDRFGEGWALHQLGTRALCLEQEAEAARWLGEALRIRERIGDEAGAAVTRNNLGHLPGLPPPSPPSGGPSGGPPWLPVLGVLGGLALLGVAAMSLMSNDGPRTAGARPAPPLHHRTGPVVHPSSSDPAQVRTHRHAGTPRPAAPPNPVAPATAARRHPLPNDVRPPAGDTTVISNRDPVTRPDASDKTSPNHPQSRQPDDPGPVPPPPAPAPTPPEPAPGTCKLPLGTVVANAVRRELGTVNRLLRPAPLPEVLASQVDVVRQLVNELLGRGCSRAGIDTELTRLGLPTLLDLNKRN